MKKRKGEKSGETPNAGEVEAGAPPVPVVEDTQHCDEDGNWTIGYEFFE